jgi:hypothetical protein
VESVFNKKYSPTKLDKTDAVLIRFLLSIGAKGKFIAKWFDIHPCNVSRIKLNKYWKQVPQSVTGPERPV